ncbi:acetate/propionate family kinase [Lysobacter niastensis]|uniref:Acetate kinase n=1 Tax=Lysobacter niastensis TaxID=380629 RepID=A0ABS0B7A2_9GAMM|nr:acetate kinase [Lysobacter niastensis]MBF6024875.1 acetate kinase [Lysobacter niastensis]
MTQSLLALNVGSATLKAASYRIGLDGPVETGRLTADSIHGTSDHEPSGVLDHAVAGLPLLAQPNVVAHRIVHGNDHAMPVELTPSVFDELESLVPLAPLHQPPALALARAALKRWPQARHYAVFDTSWHLAMAEANRILPLPRELYARGVRRYGFHGLAFDSAMQRLRSLAPQSAQGRVVLAHLGGGSSLCAVRDGLCVTTTMGMTPLGGIPMSTRPGSLDPGVILHLQRALGVTPDALDRLLWRESGLRGISGESGDMRALLSSKSPHARQAVDVYVTAVAQGVAAMAAALGGIEALAFSGGIGKHAPRIRAQVAGLLSWMGLTLDLDRNESSLEEVSVATSPVRIFTLAVDEELAMAQSVVALITAQ